MDRPVSCGGCGLLSCLREWELLALALVTAAIYGVRLTTLPIRGEETRRAEVATEILQTGDWIVPRQQGAAVLEPAAAGELSDCRARDAAGNRFAVGRASAERNRNLAHDDFDLRL